MRSAFSVFARYRILKMAIYINLVANNSVILASVAIHKEAEWT